MKGLPTALSVAGSDCSGGSGIQADIKTFHNFGVYGMSAVTAVVAENTLGVQGSQPMDPEFVSLQIESAFFDIGADAVKTGMLVGAPVISSVASTLRRCRAENIVVDPLMRAKGGFTLLDPEAKGALVRELFPLALVVTPNLPEAQELAGYSLDCEQDLKRAAEAIRQMGPKVVVLKGGHALPNVAGLSVDYGWDGNEWLVLEGERFPTLHTHGTGCTFSAAIAALLATGVEPMDALTGAKWFITEAIRTAPGLGKGQGPVNHWASYPQSRKG